jgi:hypothetical protein
MRKYAIIILFFTYLIGKAPTLEGYNAQSIQDRTVEFAKEIRAKIERNLYIEKLMFITRLVESSDNYHTIGSSGEYGAYQFMPGSWHLWSIIYFGEVLSIYIPENQDKVAKAKIGELHDKGYNHKEIAAIWNSGKPKWIGRKGINKYGIKYDVENHVNKFHRHYLLLTVKEEEERNGVNYWSFRN